MLKKTSVDPLLMLLLAIVLHSLTISALNALFVVPMILVDVITWPFLIAVYYDFSLSNDLPKQFTLITIISFIIVCLLSVPNIIIQHTENNGSAIFYTYYCFAFLPMVYLICSKRISVLFSLSVAFLMLISMKRAAFLIIIIGLITYYLLSIHMQKSVVKRSKRYSLFIAVLLLMTFLGMIIIDKMELNIIDRLLGAIEDGGSGRIRIWKQILDRFNESFIVNKIFGHGFHAVFYEIQPLGIQRYAHNSFIETLYDYGVIGLSLLTLFIIRIIKDTIMMIKEKYPLAPIMGYSIIPMVILSSVSYFFDQGTIILPFCIIWGICLGRYKRDKVSENQLKFVKQKVLLYSSKQF